MKIKPFPERFDVIIDTILSILFAPILILFLPIIYLAIKLDQWTRPSKTFTRWFAWHPITTDHGFGETLWFEWVERASWYGRTIYRRPGDLSVHEQGPETFR